VEEEILEDGTVVKIITKADGSVVRKVVRETDNQKELRKLKTLSLAQGHVNLKKEQQELKASEDAF